jgi:hypothetical protein
LSASTLIGVLEVDTAFGEQWLYLAKALDRFVMTVIAEEEDFERLRLVGGGQRRDGRQTKHERMQKAANQG